MLDFEGTKSETIANELEYIHIAQKYKTSNILTTLVKQQVFKGISIKQNAKPRL